MRAPSNCRQLFSSVPLAVLLACGHSLDSERAAWQRARPRSYVFEYQRSCFCPGSGAWWRVTVRDGSVADVLLLDSTGAERGLDYARTMPHPTLSGLFDDIAALSQRPHATSRVQYDSKWHFPSHASGDRSDRTDNYWSLIVRNFRPRE
jgi:hypothetical protein